MERQVNTWTTETRRNKIKGAVYGALIGDACGVPYEFKPPHQIPSKSLIDMVPPSDFKRSWVNIPIGTYSDDGAQILCLYQQLKEGFDQHQFRQKLLNWLDYGYMAVDNQTFDVGNQTFMALKNCCEEGSLDDERFNGNGSLMRSLPVGLLDYSERQICDISQKHSSVTHPHKRSWLCCAIYSMVVQYVVGGWDLSKGIDRAFEMIKRCYYDQPNILQEIDYIQQYENNESTGSGYVVDSLWSAFKCCLMFEDYTDVIKHAISLGDDTDTTACIAGGLSGARSGFEGLNEQWLEMLKNRDIVEQVVKQSFPDNGIEMKPITAPTGQIFTLKLPKI